MITGRDDFICGPAAAQVLADGIPRSEVVIVEDAGHMIHPGAAGCLTAPPSRHFSPGSIPPMTEIGTMRVKSGLAEMLKGGVIMDVVDAEQAKIAEEAGRVRRHGARARAGRHPPRRRRRAHVRPGHDQAASRRRSRSP